MLQPGDTAPDFVLDGSQGSITLSKVLAEGPAVVMFYPFSFTSVCQGEVCELQENVSVFDSARTKVMAIACDSSDVVKQFAAEQSISFPILSDFWPHGDVSKAYGTFNDASGSAFRSTFVIGADGFIVAAFGTDPPWTPRPFSKYTEALALLS